MAVSNLVTTGGLSTSDLVSTPEWTLLGSYATTSGASTISISANATGYRKLRVWVPGISGSASTVLRIQLNSNATNFYQTSTMGRYGSPATNMNYIQNLYTAFTPQNQAFTTSQRAMLFDIENAGNTGTKIITGNCWYSAGSVSYAEDFMGSCPLGAIVTSIQFWAESGTLATGNASYGILVFGGK
jgi:hypothetical protein